MEKTRGQFAFLAACPSFASQTPTNKTPSSRLGIRGGTWLCSVPVWNGVDHHRRRGHAKRQGTETRSNQRSTALLGNKDHVPHLRASTQDPANAARIRGRPPMERDERFVIPLEVRELDGASKLRGILLQESRAATGGRREVWVNGSADFPVATVSAS